MPLREKTLIGIMSLIRVFLYLQKEVNTMSNNNNGNLLRRLRSRHIAMIAIGGSIGTGLFIASGNAIFSAGPGGALVAFIAIGIMVYFLMTSLGEMATYMPVSGTFCKYCTDFISPSFGFAMGWNYWFNWAITMAAELSAASFIMKFWFPHVPFILWTAIFFFLILGLNVLSVRFYGEAEYWLSSMKVFAVLAFIVTGFLMIVGLIGHHPIGFQNWTIGDAPFHGGWIAIFSVFFVAGFSFQGTELVGVTAGETENPRKNIPRAIKGVFWRILIFYVLAMIVISFIIPYTNHSLINASTEHIGLSPFTIVFKRAGFTFAASLVNVIILVAVLSAGNSNMYSATRILWHLPQDKQAPKIFSQVSRQGVPIIALLATALIGSFVFLSLLFGNGVVFFWLINISSLSGFIAWFGIALSHYRFRKDYVRQGNDVKDLPYRSRLYPFAPIFCLIMCSSIIVGQGYLLIIQGHANLDSFISTYIGLPIVFLLWLGYKVHNKIADTGQQTEIA